MIQARFELTKNVQKFMFTDISETTLPAKNINSREMSYCPQAVERHDVVKILCLVIPPVSSFGVGEIREHCQPWPNLNISHPVLSHVHKPVGAVYLPSTLAPPRESLNTKPPI